MGLFRKSRQADRWTGLLGLMMASAAPASANFQPDRAVPPPAAVQPSRQAQPDWIWRYFARRDLSAAREAIAQNSPILYVERDSGPMRAWLDDGFRRAEALLPRVESEAAYRFLIEFYLRGFRDGHISHLFHDGYRPGGVASRSWPGIGLVWRHNRYLVSYVAPWVAGGPGIGAELVDCDGSTPESIARERVDLFEADLDKPVQRRRTAFRLLWDRGNPFVRSLAQCSFTQRGRSVHLTLEYRPVEDDQARTRAMDASVRTAGPTRLAVNRRMRDVWWIDIPSLNSDQPWEEFFSEVSLNSAEIRNSRFLVIDLRGNGGGSSIFAERLAGLLWGSDTVESRRRHQGFVAWRATRTNLASVQALTYRFEANPTERADLPWLHGVQQGLESAIDANAPLFIESRQAPAPDPARAPANVLKPKVILLTDERCFSACLDLMDLFMAMPNVVQAGQPTGADTIFMEMSYVTLPSGKLQIGYGIKAWLERPRGSNVPYTPGSEWLFDGNESDEDAWQSWLQGRLAREGRLSGRQR